MGGRLSPLHRETPFKKRWSLMKDGNLWQAFQKAVKAKNPWAVWVTKVKGLAKDEDVEKGEVEPEDKQINDKADEAAERGSRKEQERLAAAASLYSKRDHAYQKFMRRIHNFLVRV